MAEEKKIHYVVYLYFQRKLSEHCDQLGYITYAEAKNFLVDAYHTPKSLVTPVLKEMERIKLIKTEGKYNNLKIKVINKHRNHILDNNSRLYQTLGLF